ncbi:calcium-binding protein [Polaromonas sp. P1-6]|nr:calcium-binding protein [Polaromonas sp. P1-6]
MNGVGTEKVIGPSFTVTPDLAGFALRVRAVYQDGHSVLENVFSAPTALVTAVGTGAVNNAAVVLSSDTTPTEGALLTATVTDADGIAPAAITHQWQVGGIGTPFADIAGATGATFTPTQAQVGLNLRVVASYTDNAGNLEQVFSAPTMVVGDLIIGTAAAETLRGTVGEDNIQGLAGIDTLIGGTGADTMAGGMGNDTYEVGDAGDVVTEAAGEGSDTIWAYVNHTLAANVENLVFSGTSGNFTGTGNALDNLMVGGSGNNVLLGGSGADTLIGGRGHDTYEVTDAGDVVVENAGEGSDTIWAYINYSLAANLAVENLNFSGSAGNLVGIGNELDNLMVGGSGANSLMGGAGDDIHIGGAGADGMGGWIGNDTYEVTDAGDFVVENAGEGTDTVWAYVNHTLAANVENLNFSGSAGNLVGIGNELDNLIVGGSGANSLMGGAGDDIHIGGAGADGMGGWIGNDTYEVTDAGDFVVENAGEGNDTVWAYINYSLADNVENLILGGVGHLTGIGNGLDNTMRGNRGNNTLIGGSGADIMIGGLGHDTYEVTDADDVVLENAGEGSDTIWSYLGNYSLAANLAMENLVYGGSGNFTGIGNELDNLLRGGGGADAIMGGAGNDIHIGGAGIDGMAGWIGNDTYEVTDVGDFVVENAGEGIDTIWAYINYSLAANLAVENLNFSGSAGDLVGIGNELDNLIVGGSGANSLMGGAGDDIHIGGAGIDGMAGWIGNDTYEVTDVGDFVVENAGEGIDTVWAYVNHTLAANVENLIYGGSGIFIGTGNDLDNLIASGNGADTLDGGAGNDTLNSGAGHDTLIGGTGADALTGGYGNDMFVFSAAGFGNDRVTDFDTDALFGQDLLNISGLGITAATFAASVTIAQQGADTLVTIAGTTDSIQLVGVSSATINASDFLLT